MLTITYWRRLSRLPPHSHPDRPPCLRRWRVGETLSSAARSRTCSIESTHVSLTSLWPQAFSPLTTIPALSLCKSGCANATQRLVPCATWHPPSGTLVLLKPTRIHLLPVIEPILNANHGKRPYFRVRLDNLADCLTSAHLCSFWLWIYPQISALSLDFNIS